MKRYLSFLMLLVVLFLVGCTQTYETTQTVELEDVEETTVEVDTHWKDWELTDLNTDKIFTINDYEGTPVLVESFAVWCPTCTKQQKNIKEFHEKYGELAVSISLDTDENENEAKIKDHTNKNEFDWIYAISPNEVTQQLIEEYGLTIVSAPSVPIILICEDGSTRLMKGLKTADELKQEVENGC
jgi:peroxiredoxin